MSTAVTSVLTPNAIRHVSFVAFILISSLVFYRTLSTLVQYSLHGQSGSYILLIPVIAFSLLYFERQRIFSITSACMRSGASLSLCGALLYGLATRDFFPQEGNW